MRNCSFSRCNRAIASAWSADGSAACDVGAAALLSARAAFRSATHLRREPSSPSPWLPISPSGRWRQQDQPRAACIRPNMIAVAVWTFDTSWLFKPTTGGHRLGEVHYQRHCELGPALRSRPALNETFRSEAGAVFLGAVGKEVGFSLVRESPVASWTRVGWITLTGADGLQCPGARFLGFSLHRRLCRRREL